MPSCPCFIIVTASPSTSSFVLSEHIKKSNSETYRKYLVCAVGRMWASTQINRYEYEPSSLSSQFLFGHLAVASGF